MYVFRNVNRAARTSAIGIPCQITIPSFQLHTIHLFRGHLGSRRTGLTLIRVTCNSQYLIVYQVGCLLHLLSAAGNYCEMVTNDEGRLETSQCRFHNLHTIDVFENFVTVVDSFEQVSRPFAKEHWKSSTNHELRDEYHMASAPCFLYAGR